MIPSRVCGFVLAGVIGLMGCGSDSRSAGDATSNLEHAMLVAEDGRVATELDLERLIDGLEHPSPDVQLQAVRAIGRLERPGLHFLIQPLLRAASPDVRAEAVSAFAQAALGIARPRPGGGRQPVDVSVFSEALLVRLTDEDHPDVIGVICEALGRLPYRSAGQVSDVESAIVDVATSPPEVGTAAVLLGAAKGLESLFRLQGQLATPADRTVETLGELVRTVIEDDGRDPDRLGGSMAETTPRIRRLALGALGAAGRLDRPMLEAALGDDDPQVRRLAVVGLANAGIEGVADLLASAAEDDHAMVRIAAVRVHGSQGGSEGCVVVLAGTEDEVVHVVLESIDRLSGCEGAATERRLTELIETLPGADAPPRTWHRAAHAMVALARVMPDAAESHLEAFAGYAVWQVRAYAARAATALGDRAMLERLAADTHPNVRQAGLRGLIDAAGHDADDVYLDALDADDYQVVRLAALALEGTIRADDVPPALLSALDRLTAHQRDTSRDPRVAILDRLAELGSAEYADRLRPYVRDFDPQIAGRAAAILRNWTGSNEEPDPQPLEAPAVPDPGALALLRNATARVHMKGTGSFDVRLLVDEAPLTVARFARLARDGYYDGLTFHRVVPNFVVQGGSPGANEFVGDGPYLRDEVGLRPHLRGAIGISTRGRDTGDVQIFVDLIDNPRLDHNYTVPGQVVSGMDVVEAVLEGDVIESIEIVGGD